MALLGSLWIVVGVLATIFTIFAVLNILRDPLRDIPGPRLARFTRLWYMREVYKGHFQRKNIELHRRYGPIVRIAPGQYSFDDPEALKTIYGHGQNFVKAPWYYASGNASAEPHQLDLFSQRDPKLHAMTRRKVAMLYSMSALLKMEPLVSNCVTVFVKKLDAFATTGETIDLASWLQYFAFDVIGEITVGRAFGFLDEGKDKGGILQAIDAYLKYVSIVGIYSEWHQLATRILNAIMPKDGGFMHMAAFTQKRIEEHMSTNGKDVGKEGQSMLSQMLMMQESEKKEITAQDVFAMCMTNIGAGSDTTSISFSSIIYNLIRHPPALRKLQIEVDEAFAAGHLSSPPTFAEAQAMPYLQAVVKEALRVHPATGLPLFRVVPKGGTTLAGRFFPEGAIVGSNTWVVHANRSNFGDDATKFSPERWLESHEKTLELDRNFLTFGMGSRTCIGKNISLMEIQKTVPELIRRFEFEMVPLDATWTTTNRWFVKPDEFKCKVRLRKTVV